MDEVYRNHRIAIRQAEQWVARITHVRGHLVPIGANASLDEGHATCLLRAMAQIDRYVEFLETDAGDGAPA